MKRKRYKQIVRNRWKKAICRENIMGSYTVFYGQCPGSIGMGRTPALAWKNAAAALGVE